MASMRGERAAQQPDRNLEYSPQETRASEQPRQVAFLGLAQLISAPGNLQLVISHQFAQEGPQLPIILHAE